MSRMKLQSQLQQARALLQEEVQAMVGPARQLRSHLFLTASKQSPASMLTNRCAVNGDFTCGVTNCYIFVALSHFVVPLPKMAWKITSAQGYGIGCLSSVISVSNGLE